MFIAVSSTILISSPNVTSVEAPWFRAHLEELKAACLAQRGVFSVWRLRAGNWTYRLQKIIGTIISERCIAHPVTVNGGAAQIEYRYVGMSAIPFTDRELKRAWRDLSAIASPPPGNVRKNPHRLLLFYTVECGLKAVWLKRQNRTLFDRADIEKTGHDLREVLKELKVGSHLSLPPNLQLFPIMRNQNQVPRNGDISILHQAWRYGGECTSPTDQDCEVQLQKVLDWIQGELK